MRVERRRILKETKSKSSGSRKAFAPNSKIVSICVFRSTSVIGSRSGGAGSVRPDGGSATRKKAPTTNPTVADSKVETLCDLLDGGLIALDPILTKKIESFEMGIGN